MANKGYSVMQSLFSKLEMVMLLCLQQVYSFGYSGNVKQTLVTVTHCVTVTSATDLDSLSPSQKPTAASLLRTPAQNSRIGKQRSWLVLKRCHTNTTTKARVAYSTLTWHASKYKVHKFNQRYMLKKKGCPSVACLPFISGMLRDRCDSCLWDKTNF